jgi:hypothetical protein
MHALVCVQVYCWGGGDIRTFLNAVLLAEVLASAGPHEDQLSFACSCRVLQTYGQPCPVMLVPYNTPARCTCTLSSLHRYKHRYRYR